jgi:hypothetical protein
MGELAYPEYALCVVGRCSKWYGGGAKATGKAKVPSKQRSKKIGKVKTKAKSKRK